MGNFLITLIQCSASMSVLVLCFIALTQWLSKRYAAKWLYYVWLVIVVGLIIPFRFHPDTALIQISASPSHIKQIMPRNIEHFAESAIKTNEARQELPVIKWHQFIGYLWMAGLFTFIFYHGLKHYRFIRMVNRWGEQVNDPKMLDTLQKIKKNMRIVKPVKLLICSCISSPMMIGFIRPVILLPRLDFSADELSFILRHEMVHFKRKDLWYKSLVFLSTAIHWFNPVIYLMAKAIALQCEISCDAEVVNETDMDERQQYSETIIGVIKNQCKMQTAFSTNFYGGMKGMKKRIFSIMDTSKKKTGVIVLSLILIGTMGTGIVFAGSNKTEDNLGKKIQITSETSTILAREDENGNAKISTDEGKTWMSEEEYDKAHPTSDVVWWTYDEYKAWLEEEKKTLPSIIGGKGWTSSDGWFVWTQEKVDEAIARYEEILADIKNGMKVSKTVDGRDDIVMFHTPSEIVTGKSYVIIDDKGNTKVFNDYDSKEDLLAAVKLYCEKQVKNGNMTQSEADETISEVNAMK